MLPDPTPFLKRLFTGAPGHKGHFDHLQIDHLCYRVSTSSRYLEVQELLAAANELLVESRINGRMISTFRMAEPFLFRGQEIWLLELPEPKSGSPYAEGWEHAELVTDRPLDAFYDWLLATTQMESREINRSGLSKSVNADLRILCGPTGSLKFHELPLDEVIRMELAQRDGMTK